MTIDTTHGIVENANSSLFVHRNLLDRTGFMEYLSRRPKRYGPLRDAIAGQCDALTLDDSTVAAADAARAARQLGHEVTLFVNGFNIVEASPYFFSRLNAALDGARRTTVVFGGTRWNLGSRSSRERFREEVKNRLARLSDEKSRQGLVEEIAGVLDCGSLSVPHYLNIITESELKELIAIGVDIQNHGWTHSRMGSLPVEDHAVDIRLGREWLQRTCNIEADLYAVPNGDGLPPWRDSPHYRAWFLLDRSGELPAGVYSRNTLTLKYPLLRRMIRSTRRVPPRSPY